MISIDWPIVIQVVFDAAFIAVVIIVGLAIIRWAIRSGR